MTLSEIVLSIGIGFIACAILILIAMETNNHLQYQNERQFAERIATEFAIRETDYATLASKGLYSVTEQITELASKGIFPSPGQEANEWCVRYAGQASQPSITVGKCLANTFGYWEWGQDQPLHAKAFELIEHGRFTELIASDGP